MKNLLFILFILVSASVMAQQEFVINTTDSLLVKNFILSSKNDAAETGKFKNLQINIARDSIKKTYQAIFICNREINSYLEIKDQDDNVIFFDEIAFVQGTNKINLETEDGEQSLFSFSFQDIKTAKPAVIVLREVEEVLYINISQTSKP